MIFKGKFLWLAARIFVNILITILRYHMAKITSRTINLESHFEPNLHPLLERIYLARGINQPGELERDLAKLLPFTELMGIATACEVLTQAIIEGQHIMIIGDYDADGATSTTLAVRVLREFGAAEVSYLVPNRFEYGYGLTPEIVAVAAERKPDILLTVDNGIASIAGVAAANALNIKVVVTDHHLAGDELPAAAAIVNPNQPGDSFASKALAGVGVCFYVMLALRRELIAQDYFTQHNLPVPKLAKYLDIVALGTVADVVPLDKNNRILVHQGLHRIRAGHCVPGIKAILTVAKRDITQLTSADLGFAIGPRLNAAGRLDDMSLGIECLLTDDEPTAMRLAQELNDLNVERREIEQGMQQEALKSLADLKLDASAMPYGLCLFDATWHQGVIGILASRIKDKYHRPVIVFADAGGGTIKGSARSVRGVHIRDVLDAIAKRNPDLISKFGGHAMAAGLSFQRADYKTFTTAFDEEVRKHLTAEDLQGEVYTDGELSHNDFNLGMAELLRDAGPWGQAFPEPVFYGEFILHEQRIVGQNHLRLKVQLPEGKKVYTGIKFNIDLKQWPNHRAQKVNLAYKLDINEYNNVRSLQLMVEHIEAL